MTNRKTAILIAGGMLASAGVANAVISAVRVSGVQMTAISSTPIQSSKQGVWVDNTNKLRFDDGSNSNYVAYATTANAFLPLAGGTMTGDITVNGGATGLKTASAQLGVVSGLAASATIPAVMDATSVNLAATPGYVWGVCHGVGNGGPWCPLKLYIGASTWQLDLASVAGGAGGSIIYNQAQSRYQILSMNVVPYTDKSGASSGDATHHWNGDYATRIYLSGTAQTAGNIAISAGWGGTATVGTITGDDSHFSFVVTATVAPSANPTIVFTFKDGTWTNAPTCMVKLEASTDTLTAPITETTSATALTITYNATPVAAKTYTFAGICIGAT